MPSVAIWSALSTVTGDGVSGLVRRNSEPVTTTSWTAVGVVLGALVWEELDWAASGVPAELGAWVAEEGAVCTALGAWAKPGTAPRSAFAATAPIKASPRDLNLTHID